MSHVSSNVGLTVVAESFEVHKTVDLFETGYSHIYFLFHEGFTNVEASLAQRGNVVNHNNNRQ